ncbi:MAG: hypothetical protein P8L85_18875 [Rubripirellula sp.]|nr:hypothetical protein [Rubripirellula sp.]
MKSLKLQPTFLVELDVPPSELMTRVRTVMRNQAALDDVSEIASAGNCIDVKVPRQQQRFWSPHLNAHVSEHDAGSEIYCRFSPRPEVWTMVMAVYFVATFFICSCGIYGYVQWVMETQPWAFALIPIGLLMIAGLHLASLFGQKLSEDQMDHLRTRLEQVVKLAVS